MRSGHIEVTLGAKGNLALCFTNETDQVFHLTWSDNLIRKWWHPVSHCWLYLLQCFKLYLPYPNSAFILLCVAFQAPHVIVILVAFLQVCLVKWPPQIKLLMRGAAILKLEVGSKKYNLCLSSGMSEMLFGSDPVDFFSYMRSLFFFFFFQLQMERTITFSRYRWKHY